jgi:HSP20 family protein
MVISIFNDLYRLNREMNRVLTFAGKSDATVRTNYGYWPEVNVYSNENEYVLAAKIPGIEKNDVSISIKDNSLKIAGERKNEENPDANYHLRERKSGKFERNFLLDEKVDADKVTAEIKNGILLIKVPKSPESKPVKIEVK